MTLNDRPRIELPIAGLGFAVFVGAALWWRVFCLISVWF